MIIDLPESLATHLASWIKDANPNGSEPVAEDLKRYLADFVDLHTISRATIERDIRKQLSSFNVYFTSRGIEVCDSGVSLIVTGQSREGCIRLSSDNFASSDELSSLAGYAEEMENSVWDDDAVESLIEKWFDLEG